MSTAEDPRSTMDDLGMMRRADLWPVWPKLPVKRRPAGSPAWETGFLVEEGATRVARPTVYDHRGHHALHEYSSLEELHEDGWQVD